jgi:hypothetical protein
MLSLSSSLFRLGVGGVDPGPLIVPDTVGIGCKLVEALARLAAALAGRGAALTQVQAVQLASSLAVVWQLGRNMLEQRLNEARAGGLQQVLLDDDKILFRIAFCQVLAVCNMLTFLHVHAPPGAAASFARGFMKPGTVLPWLEAVAKASELLPESAQEAGEPLMSSAAAIACGPAGFSAPAAATMLGSILAAKKNAAVLLCHAEAQVPKAWGLHLAMQRLSCGTCTLCARLYFSW